MRVLVACEFSGVVRSAFYAKGHDAWSCDLLPTEDNGPHIQGDVRDVLNQGWDLMIAHPPCTHLAVSGARWFRAKQADGRQQAGIEFFLALAATGIPKIAMENPIGIMSRHFRKPDQVIQPFQFGHEVQKATCLWLKGLPLLMPTKIVDRGIIYIDPRGNKHGGEFTNRAKRGYSSLMLLPRNTERWKIRSRTFEGIAQAMAEQWGGLARSAAREEK
jgi:site-specific DNA-cytosine methylase